MLFRWYELSFAVGAYQDAPALPPSLREVARFVRDGRSFVFACSLSCSATAPSRKEPFVELVFPFPHDVALTPWGFFEREFSFLKLFYIIYTILTRLLLELFLH